MELLIGAVFAIGLLTVIYGVVTSVSEYQPGSDVVSVSGELLASAYSAAGSGEFFHRTAKLQAQLFDTDSLKAVSGLPAKTPLEIHCEKSFCLVDGVPVTDTMDCSMSSGCDAVELVSGAEVDLCAACSGTPISCHLAIGERSCEEFA